MLSGLILTSFLMGLGGVPHCAAMCGAPCALAFPRGVPWLSLLGRCLAYGGLGALAAASAGRIAAWGRQVSFVQPIWMMALAAAVILGVWLLLKGDMPAAVNEGAQALYRKVRQRWGRPGHAARATALAPLFAGMAWAVMPCGLLYAALTVAALAPDAGAGALVMLAFSLPGAVGVWAAPTILRWLMKAAPTMGQRRGTQASPDAFSVPIQSVPITWARMANEPACAVSAPTSASAQFDPRWAVRLSGVMLAGMAGWALYHQLWAQWQAWCA